MPFAGRRHELQEIGRLLERAAGGAGGLLAITGPPGSGKTALAEATTAEAGNRGFEVLRADPPEGQPGRLVWAQLLRDVKAPEDLVTRLSGNARDIAERLGLTHLLDRLARPASEWSLSRDGDDWLLEAGGERARLRDGRGLHYLRALLAAPGRDISALDLAGRGGAGGGRGDRAGPRRRRPGRLPSPARHARRRGRRRRPGRGPYGRGQAGGRAAGAGRRAEPGGRAGRP